ncbi:MAG: hypothetical protein C4551_10895 [Bacillota bacterium]|nr:MAG: hypothetical protein C4551_10895 [Bacillota bacterium]
MRRPAESENTGWRGPSTLTCSFTHSWLGLGVTVAENTTSPVPTTSSALVDTKTLRRSSEIPEDAGALQTTEATDSFGGPLWTLPAGASAASPARRQPGAGRRIAAHRSTRQALAGQSDRLIGPPPERAAS